MSKEQIGLNLYLDYIEKAGSRIEVFRALNKEFNIKSALYPGSYVHITPSLIFPEIVYVDTDKRAYKFFTLKDEIWNHIDQNKEYREDHQFKFFSGDYQNPIKIPLNSFDLLISDYAGFVSLHTKKYLKRNGVLIAGDSHGDATIANSDPDYNFMGVLEYNCGQYVFQNKDNENYFKRNKNLNVDMDLVIKKMKGPKYSKSADYYIFQKQG